MKTLINNINDELAAAFKACGYDCSYARASISNRPDLCEYQCNGALAAAKQYKKKPIDIASEVAEILSNQPCFEKIEAVMPGFINIDISKDFLKKYIINMSAEEKLGIELDTPKTIIVDYGGANVAKPLHIGHLRSAIIGESIKRMGKYFGNHMIADVHLGDWGLQMGLIIEELKETKPNLPYFDESFDGEYPSEAPFTISELEKIYPAASAKAKEDSEYKKRAQHNTYLLQNGYKPYTAIWKHIMNVSVADLKKNYNNLDVSFDLWKGESDAQPYIPALIKDLEDRHIAHESDGALVVDVAEEGDSKEYPPCIIRKSDGAALYATSDLATIVEREKLYKPDEYIYVTDKRQELHFIQVFRTAKKAGIVPEDRKLIHIGFGTMNGKDGKPFKTRDGGVMRLEALIKDIDDAVYNKIIENRDVSEEAAQVTAKIVGLAALKYADLSNQAAKDYIFDIERFASFEGNTGPYILYTIVRINSILKKFYESEGKEVTPADLTIIDSTQQKKLLLELSRFNELIKAAWEDLAPHKICAYIYSIADLCNGFYHDVKILSQEDEAKKRSYLYTMIITRRALLDAIHMLGIEAPEEM